MGGEDAHRIGAEADEGGVAERHQCAIADEEVEREGSDGEDHDTGDEVQHIGFAAERRREANGGKDEKQGQRQCVGTDEAA
jgi:hypothetical protein